MTANGERVDRIRRELATTIQRLIRDELDLQTPVPGLWLYRRTAPSTALCQVYEPALALVAQGAKKIEVGGTSYSYGEASWLLTPLGVPAIARIVKASEEKPYFSCALSLDLPVAREIMSEQDVPVEEALSRDRAAPARRAAPAGRALTAEQTVITGRAVTTGPVTADLLDAMLRLVRLLDTPQHIPVMAKLLQREILYRLLTSKRGAMLRQIVTVGTQSQRVARAVSWLRENFRGPLRVDELAMHARMGVSTLHHHFRALTGLSPLQFQKQLRLFEARRLMLVEGMDAGSAAFATGYESSTQFSREYRRQFGQPPLRDVMHLRAVAPDSVAFSG